MDYNYNHATEKKCAWCDKIAPRTESFWQFAANLPFHYVCSNQCATDLKDYFAAQKELKEAKKKS
jgi:hypothetical protein